MNSEMFIEIPPGTARLAWPLKPLSLATNTSVAFWKKIIAKGEIPVTKFGSLNAILDEDLREWLMKNRKVRGNGHELKPAA